MIAPQVAITAAHCLPGTSGMTILKARLVAGYDGPAALRPSIETRDVQLAPSPILPIVGDIALVAITTPFSDQYPPLPLRYRNPAHGETLIVISHPLGQAKRLSTLHCVVTSIDNLEAGQFNHSCATLGGSSGALLIAASDFAVVGVHSQNIESNDVAAKDNLAFALGPLADALRQMPSLSLLLQIVPKPTRFDLTGISVSDSAVRTDFQAAARERRASAWLGDLIASGTSVAEFDMRLGLAELAARNDDVAALRALAGAGVRFDNERGKHLLIEIADLVNDYSLSDARAIGVLLDLQAPVARSRDGMLPYCQLNAVESLKMEYRRHGYTNCNG